MRLLVLCPHSGSGGTERYMLAIAGAAAAAEWEVHCAFPIEDGPACVGWVSQCQAAGVRHWPLAIADHTPRSRALAGVLVRAARTLRLLRVRPDVVQINMPYPDRCLGSVLACAALGVPTALTFHTVPPEMPFPRGLPRLFRKARARRQRWSTVSQCSARLIGSHFAIDPAQVQVIYNGLEAPAFDLPSSAARLRMREEVRRELGLPSATRLGLNVARVGREKGFEELVPTLPHLAREFPDLHIVWIGEGYQQQRAADLAARYGVQDRFHLPGFRSDVPRFLAAADFFVFPSHFESCPFALLQAMAQGLPIIASDSTSMPELIRSGTDGLLFAAGDSCDLLESLRRLLRNPGEAARLGASARERAGQFTHQRMVSETLGFLTNLARPARGGA